MHEIIIESENDTRSKYQCMEMKHEVTDEIQREVDEGESKGNCPYEDRYVHTMLEVDATSVFDSFGDHVVAVDRQSDQTEQGGCRGHEYGEVEGLEVFGGEVMSALLDMDPGGDWLSDSPQDEVTDG